MTEKKFIEARGSNGMQMFINLEHVSYFAQASGSNSPTEITFNNGKTITINTDYPSFRKALGLDKDRSTM